MREPPTRQFPYSMPDGTLDELDSLPRLPLILHYGGQRVEAIGLVDSGATVNVLPYRVGLALGALWSAQGARHYGWRAIWRTCLPSPLSCLPLSPILRPCNSRLRGHKPRTCPSSSAKSIFSWSSRCVFFVRNLGLNSQNGRRGSLAPYKVRSRTRHWSRRPIASAPPSLPPLGAAHRGC